MIFKDLGLLHLLCPTTQKYMENYRNSLRKTLVFFVLLRYTRVLFKGKKEFICPSPQLMQNVYYIQILQRLLCRSEVNAGLVHYI